jgi:ABC-2 type transport system permease protein
LGEALADVLLSIDVTTAEGRKSLFTIRRMKVESEAVSQVELGEVRGALIIPAGFSQVLQTEEKKRVELQVYTDPSSGISSSVNRGAIQRVANGFNTLAVGNVVAVEQLSRALDENTAPEVYANLENIDEILTAENIAFGEQEKENDRISVKVETAGEAEEYNLLGYFVPSMSIFFLTFSAFAGTRSILEEEQNGTLHRLMNTPILTVEILLGKIGGALVTGVLQFAILVFVSAVFFQVHWADNLLALVLLSVMTVFSVTSLGAFLASFARNANQAKIIGTTVSLVFAILGGNFLPTMSFPAWLTFVSKLTVNRWALDGFVNLAISHATFAETLPYIGVLFGMAIFYFMLSAVFFSRRFVR